MTTASWVEANRFARLNARCEGWANARFAAFEKCGFYSTDVTHGGPKPGVEYKETNNSYWGAKKEKVNLFEDRKRRSADDCSNWDGNTDGITYFQFHDVIEKETVRVQGDEPCAPDYIDPAWLSPDYVKSIQEELNEDCTDDCQNEADVDACEAKCSQVSRSSGSVRPLLVLPVLNLNFSASNASKIVVHGDRRAQLSLECANGASVTWLSVPVVVQVVTWSVATNS
jgi:hypothetical protein